MADRSAPLRVDARLIALIGLAAVLVILALATSGHHAYFGFPTHAPTAPASPMP